MAGQGDGAPPRARWAQTGSSSVDEMMTRLSANSAKPKDHEYRKTTVETTCPLYQGLEINECDFKEYYRDYWLPRIWQPQMAAGEKLRDKKYLQLMIQARTGALRSRRSLASGLGTRQRSVTPTSPAPAPSPAAAQAEAAAGLMAAAQAAAQQAQEDASNLAAALVVQMPPPPGDGEGDGAGQQPAVQHPAQPAAMQGAVETAQNLATQVQQMLEAMNAVAAVQAAAREQPPPHGSNEEEEEMPLVDPETDRMMQQLADQEMPTADEQFSLLLKYIHEEVQLKDVILNDLLLKVGELTGEQKIEHFVTEMAKATSAAVLHKAIWLGLQRDH